MVNEFNLMKGPHIFPDDLTSVIGRPAAPRRFFSAQERFGKSSEGEKFFQEGSALRCIGKIRSRNWILEKLLEIGFGMGQLRRCKRKKMHLQETARHRVTGTFGDIQTAASQNCKRETIVKFVVHTLQIILPLSVFVDLVQDH